MKIRTDYVTNSSSSSFILAFNNSNRWRSYESFKETCDYDDYEAFFKLIDSLKSDSDNTDKNKALAFLFSQYTHDYKWELLEQVLDRNAPDYYKQCIALEETEEFQTKLREYAERNPEYVKKRAQIEEADFVVTGTVWDTSGGLLEWAIRNGFIEDNFGCICVTTYNIG